MSTFVIRLVDRLTESLKGRVQHVGTGEEATFSSPKELIAFIEGIAAMQSPPAGETGRAGQEERIGGIPVDQRVQPRDLQD